MCAYEFKKTIILKVRKCGGKNIDTFFSSRNKMVVQRDSFRNQGKQQPRNELLWNHCEINLCEVMVTFGRVATEIAFSLVVCMVFVALSGFGNRFFIRQRLSNLRPSLKCYSEMDYP